MDFSKYIKNKKTKKNILKIKTKKNKNKIKNKKKKTKTQVIQPTIQQMEDWAVQEKKQEEQKILRKIFNQKRML